MHSRTGGRGFNIWISGDMVQSIKEAMWRTRRSPEQADEWQRSGTQINFLEWGPQGFLDDSQEQ